jgi:hypothetical protein
MTVNLGVLTHGKPSTLELFAVSFFFRKMRKKDAASIVNAMGVFVSNFYLPDAF